MHTNNPTEGKSFKERELAEELYFTSVCFTDLDISEDTLCELDEDIEESTMFQENTPSEIMKEESLRYIGGYTVRKFNIKYPYLENKVLERMFIRRSWIDSRNKRWGVFPFSRLFFSVDNSEKYIQVSSQSKSYRREKSFEKK